MNVLRACGVRYFRKNSAPHAENTRESSHSPLSTLPLLAAAGEWRASVTEARQAHNLQGVVQFHGSATISPHSDKRSVRIFIGRTYRRGDCGEPFSLYPKPKGLGSNGEERRKRNGKPYTGIAAPCLRSRRLPVERKSGRGTYTPSPFEAFKTGYESCEDNRPVPSPINLWPNVRRETGYGDSLSHQFHWIHADAYHSSMLAIVGAMIYDTGGAPVVACPSTGTLLGGRPRRKSGRSYSGSTWCNSSSVEMPAKIRTQRTLHVLKRHAKQVLGKATINSL